MKAIRYGALVALLGAITVATLLAGNGSLALALLPAIVLATLFAVSRMPLCHPLLVLMFLALTLENPSDVPAANLWKSALYPVGSFLLAHINLSLPSQKWLVFSGLDVIMVGLFALSLSRFVSRSRIDSRIPGASPMRLFVLVSLGGAAWMWIWGMARGGADVASSLWQVQRVVYLPMFYLLFERALRGPLDIEVLGRVVVAAACVKAALAIYLRATLVPPAGMATIDYATTHADSMLFAGAFCLVIAAWLARVGRGHAIRSVLVLSLLVGGMVANHRRIVWVELAAGLFTLYVMSPWSPVKRAIARAAIIAAPIVILYGAVGWGSTGGIFSPVETVRSMIDSKADGSTEWRDWENYNLFFTLRQNPLLGTGYGHGYVETVKLPDISAAYSLYRFIPHNSILGLWAYGGIVGFTALWSMLVVGIFLAARASRRAIVPSDRVAANASIAGIVVYLVHCYGDMGLGTWTSVFTVAPALAVASKLAVMTGAWPRRVVETPRVPEITIVPKAEAS